MSLGKNIINFSLINEWISVESVKRLIFLLKINCFIFPDGTKNAQPGVTEMAKFHFFGMPLINFLKSGFTVF